MTRKKYSVILSDCPWQYDDRKGSRGVENHYRTLSETELMHLRVRDLAADDSMHFMWVTGPFMLAGIRIMQAWGFKYVGVAFVWVKTNKKSKSLFWGMGHTTRSNSEFVLLGRRGKLPVQSHGVHSVVMSPVLSHSQKPDEVRSRIVELCGDVPRLELFARSKCDGWDQTGLELDGRDVRDYIDEVAPAPRLSALIGRT